MNRWFNIIGQTVAAFTLPLGLMMSGCSETDGSIDSGAGYIVPYITVDPNVVTAVKEPSQTILVDVPDTDILSLRITDQSGEYSHTWTPITDFSTTDPLRPGKYLVEAFYGSDVEEGFDRPYFYGSSMVEVSHNQTTETSIECKLANTMIGIHYTDNFRNYFPSYRATLHSSGGGYVTFGIGETKAAYLNDGNIGVGLYLTLPDGRSVSFSPTSIPNALPRYYYNLTLGFEKDKGDTPKIIVSFDEKTASDDVVIELTEEFLNAKGPSLTPIGFDPSAVVGVAEGNIPSSPLQIAVSTLGAPLEDLILTTLSPSLRAAGWPPEVNLLEMDEQTEELLKKYGLKISDRNTLRTVGGVIDLTNVVPCLRYDRTSPENQFILEAKDKNTHISSPLGLKVAIEPVDLSVIGLSSSIIGINEAEAVIEAPSASLDHNLEVQINDPETKEWVKSEIIEVSELGGSRYVVRFKVPSGTSNLLWRILYCGSVRNEAEIKRVAPQYTLDYDPYAMKLAVRVKADDESLTPIVTSKIKVYDGNRQLSIMERNRDKGIVLIAGLQPNRKYTLKTTLSDHPADKDFTSPVTIHTEPTTSVPNGSFEDINLTIDYKDMLSGGRYSQDFIEIFNRQNRTTFALSTPKEWANTNSKTFCTDAVNHNTWYLQPSVAIVNEAWDEAYGVKLTSVAWDIEGPEIPDYLQESSPFVKYSRNVPRIAYRAAGKLFLGSYRFDPSTLTETYQEGVAINSRPSAFNGYYAYQPGEDSQSDRGEVRVEVLGRVGEDEVCIARSSLQLVPAQSYTAFSVPLVYERFGVKATKIKIMFSSSVDMGTIARETDLINTTPYPQTSTSTGSSLWIDDLTYSY